MNYKLFSIFICNLIFLKVCYCSLDIGLNALPFLFVSIEGLNLEINIEQDEYIGPLTPEAGIRVDISPQGAMPFPLDKGVSLAPGYATMIGMRKVICLLCNWSVCLIRGAYCT